MLAGNLNEALNLAPGPGLAGTQFTYSFYNQASDIPYQANRLPFPVGTAASNSTYGQAFSPLTATERVSVVAMFDTRFDFVPLEFASEADPAAAVPNFGGLNYTTSEALAWAGPPGFPVIAGDAWFTAPAIASDFARNALHETGHLLGLAGDNNISAAYDSIQFTVMSYDPTVGLTSPTEYQLHDVAALQYLYGANNQSHSGNTTYSADDFVGAAGFDRQWSIWDASGDRDVIDASAIPAAAVFIDLRPGHFSTIGEHSLYQQSWTLPYGQLNVSIAFGSYIEDAIGTARSDGLIGNSFSNRLDGGASHDQIYGDGFAAGAGGAADANYSRVEKGQIIAFSPDPTLQSDTLVGGAGLDQIFGSRGGDLIQGGQDEDFLYGNAGNDTIQGGLGSDDLHGGAGNDRLEGGQERDRLSGDDGNDLLVGGGAANPSDLEIVEGGSGDDTLVLAASGRSNAATGDGSDVVFVEKGQVIPWSQHADDTWWIEDLSPQDELYWNGYRLDGGIYTILDAEGGATLLANRLDEHGVIYDYLSEGGVLYITLPTNEVVAISDFHNGDGGIVIGEIPTDPTLIPRSNIVEDGLAYNFDSLAGRAQAIATPGPYEWWV